MGEFFVFSTFFGVLLLLFPIFVDLHLYVDILENKASFALSPFGLRMIGGYCELRKEGAAIHLTEKFAVLIPYASMRDTRKYFEVTAGFQLYRFRQVVETGGAAKISGLLLAAALQAASGATFAVLKTRHPFLRLFHGTLLADRPTLKITLMTTTVFNGLIVAIAIGKKLLEACINWIRKRRSMRSWKRQPSSS